MFEIKTTGVFCLGQKTQIERIVKELLIDMRLE